MLDVSPVKTGKEIYLFWIFHFTQLFKYLFIHFFICLFKDLLKISEKSLDYSIYFFEHSKLQSIFYVSSVCHYHLMLILILYLISLEIQILMFHKYILCISFFTLACQQIYIFVFQRMFLPLVNILFSIKLSNKSTLKNTNW